MNTESTTAEQQRVIAQAAASYTPPEPQSHALLMPHRESIAVLRSKGASYRAIVKILGRVSISVSLDTLSRFCREAIEPKPTRRSRRRATASQASGQTEARPSAPGQSPAQPDSPAPAKEDKAAEPAAASRGKGPRIADPDNI